MKEIFVESQWDTLWTFLQQGYPPLWILLAAVNGAFLLFWLFAKLVKDRPLRPATIGVLRALFFFLNVVMVFRDDTLRLVRPLFDYIPNFI